MRSYAKVAHNKIAVDHEPNGVSALPCFNFFRPATRPLKVDKCSNSGTETVIDIHAMELSGSKLTIHADTFNPRIPDSDGWSGGLNALMLKEAGTITRATATRSAASISLSLSHSSIKWKGFLSALQKFLLYSSKSTGKIQAGMARSFIRSHPFSLLSWSSLHGTKSVTAYVV